MFEDENHNSMFLSWWEMTKERDNELARRNRRGRGTIGGSPWGGRRAPEEGIGFLGLTIMLPHLGLPTFLSVSQFSHYKTEGFHRVEDILNTYIQ